MPTFSASCCQLLDESILPFVEVVNLSGKEIMAALRQGKARGVRGGAVYDFLHLVTAKKAGALKLVTLDRRNFEALTAGRSSNRIAVARSWQRTQA